MRISVTPIDVKDENNVVLFSFNVTVPVITVEELNAINSLFDTSKSTFPVNYGIYQVLATNGVLSNYGAWIKDNTFRPYSHLPFYDTTGTLSVRAALATYGFTIDLGDFINSIPDSDFLDYGNVYFYRTNLYRFTSGSFDTTITNFRVFKHIDSGRRYVEFVNQLVKIAGFLGETGQQSIGYNNEFLYGAAFYLVEDNGAVVGWSVENINTGYINYRPYYGTPTSDNYLSEVSATAPTYADGAIPYLVFMSDARRVQDDPYDDGGHSGSGGGPGTGTFDISSDAIGLPALPTLSFASTGFTRIYNPTLSELNSLANYLWTDQTFLDTVINHLKQLLENPMDAVISLSLLPCPIPNGAPEAVKVMYINTGVAMAPATTQFVDVDCGTYSIEEFYGSALDYNPYTKVHCYLPYIGQVTLDTDEVMGRTLQVVYRIDIVTGMCAAMILVNQNVLYQFSGHCSINMPINSADFSGYIGAAMTAGKMVAGVVAGAAGLAPLAAELVGTPAPHATVTHTMDTTRSTDLIKNQDTHRQTERRTRTVTSPEVSFGELSRKAVANTVGAVMGSKLTVEHAGGFTGNSGYLAVRRPYLIIERPRMCNPEEYGKYNGRPSMIYMSLRECLGYTEVQSIQFNGISATNPELSELSELLKSGVIF